MDLKEKVLDRLIYIAPNRQDAEYFVRNINGANNSEVQTALDDLVREQTVEKSSASLPGNTLHYYYSLRAEKTIKIRKIIQIGNTAVPRLLTQKSANPEDINESVEALAKYADGLEERFKEITSREREAYWGNLIIVFGIFVTIFAFITNSFKSVKLVGNNNFLEAALQNLVILIPLAVVLLLFILLLSFLFRSKK